jgi:peptide/nickel transport system substrate-binding protein
MKAASSGGFRDSELTQRSRATAEEFREGEKLMAKPKFTRRDFLRASAAAAAGVLATSCATPTAEVIKETVVVEKEVTKVVEKIITATPLPPPPKFNEVPMLAELVKAGELPSADQRLPADLMVIRPVEEIGEYGGTWHAVHGGPDMGELKMIFGYDTPVRCNMDYTEYIPNLARETKISEDGKTFTIYFRRGLKWSDGQPFTTEDLKFWWEDLALNEEYEVITRPWWGYKGGKPMEVEFIDDYTMVFHLAEPDFSVVPNVFGAGFWEWEPLMKPKHYLKQFHPKYNPDSDWETFQEKDYWWQNPDYPVVFAWHCVSYVPGERVVFERNPYYWKVDTAGNQLPYIDRIESTEVPNEEVRLLQVAAGQCDATWRGVYDPRNVPLLQEKAEAGDYRVILWEDACDGWPGFLINQNYVEDEWMRNLLRDVKFRKALSCAIDRDRMNEVLWGGLGRPQQGVAVEEHSWGFQNLEGQKAIWEWATSDIAYDPEKVGRTLDEIGLAGKDTEGFRTRPDGSKLEFILDITDWGGVGINTEAATILKEEFEAVGLRTILNAVYGTAESDLRQTEGTYQLRMAVMGGFNLWTYPDEVFPTRDNRAWPMVGKWHQTGGKEGEAPEPGSPEERLLKLYEKGAREPDFDKRCKLLQDAIRIHIEEGPFFMGMAGNLPIPVVVKNNFRNVPNYGILGPWEVGAPGNTCPEQYFFKQG